MALSDILEKIKKETDEKIVQLEKSFEDKNSKLEENDRERRKTIENEMDEKVEVRSNKLVEKAENLAERERKNKLLKSKHRLIDKALDQTIEALVTSDKYEDILVDMLKKADLKGDVVVVPAKGREDSTTKAIKESGKDYSLAEKASPIRGGFILKTEKVEVDNSFETIIGEQLREDLEIKLHKLMF